MQGLLLSDGKPVAGRQIAWAVWVIGDSGHANRETRGSLVNLAEPDKACESLSAGYFYVPGEDKHLKVTIARNSW